MGWTANSDHEAKAIEGLSTSDDRTVAIIAATIVEARLREAIERVLVRDEPVEKEMFRTTGPLGMFASKINLALLMGLISKQAWKNLDTMKNIRNRFAHYIDITDFQSQQIRDWCKNLDLIERHFQHFDAGKGYNPHGVDFIMYAENLDEKLRDPRWRYLMTAMLFSTALVFPKGRRANI
jgi:hypothetical protein